jgi:molybdopterin-guanine dinucleotide biosynthesis protein A
VSALRADHDIILVEGHKTTPLPKLWLCRDGESAPSSAVTGVQSVLPWGVDRVPVAMSAITKHVEEEWRERPMIAGILIGGGSTRLGRPKQLLEVGGLTMVEHLVRVVSDHVELTVFLGSGVLPPSLEGFPRLPDARGVRGPSAGLVSALRWDRIAAWLVIACDQPLVSREAVEWLLGHRRLGRWAVLPRLSNGMIEPFLAVYEPQALPLLEEPIAGGRTAPVVVSDHPSVVCPEPPAELEKCWLNVNTLEEYERLVEG